MQLINVKIFHTCMCAVFAAWGAWIIVVLVPESFVLVLTLRLLAARYGGDAAVLQQVCPLRLVAASAATLKLHPTHHGQPGALA